MSEVTIGGSEAAAAVGLDPFRSTVQLWAEKTGRLEPQEAGEQALWGTLLEPVIREQVGEHGYEVYAPPGGFAEERSDSYRWMIGHRDGQVARAGRTHAGVYEGKTAGHWTAHHWHDSGAPPAYIIQLHHYLILTGLQWGLLACLVAGQKLELREIERDDALCDLIVNLEGEFVEHVRADTPPAPDGSAATTEVLKRLYPATSGEVVALTGDDYAKVEELRKVRRSVKLGEEAQARLENELKVRLGDAAVATFDGQKVVSWTDVTSRRFDQAACKAEAPEVYERFLRESSYRRFLVHGG